jgi:HEAT repeat protein
MRFEMRFTLPIVSLILLCSAGCDAFRSDPPAEIQQKAKETIRLESYTISTAAPGTGRVEKVRPPIVPQSPRITPLEERGLPETAADALARIGAPAVPQVTAMLGDPNPVLRARAARILAQIGDGGKAAVPALVARLNDEDEEVRKAAAHALGQMGPAAADAVPALLRAAGK